MREKPPSLFVIDEAHCISEWGHDFRPDYLRLGGIIEALWHPVVLAMTATAAGPVRDEITSRLVMRDPLIVVRGFDRPNIQLRVDHFATEKEKFEAILTRVQDAPKPGIIYVVTRKHADDVGQALSEAGVRTISYHGGLPARERHQLHEEFASGEADVVVATKAFGMGIDKADVRFVFHYDIPDSLDSYYQEVGRAGRDGKPALALLFYRLENINVPKFLKSGGKIEEQKIQQVGEVLERADQPVPIDSVKEATNLSGRKVERVINRLEEVGAVERLPTGEAVLTELGPDLAEAVRMGAEEEQKHREYEALRLEKMQAYAKLGNCRREYLLHYFGEEDIQPPCGNCDNCLKRSGVKTEGTEAKDTTQERQPSAKLPGTRRAPKVGKTPPGAPFAIHSRVLHARLGKGVVHGYNGDKMDVLFDDYGHKILSCVFVMGTGMLQALTGEVNSPE